MDISCFNSKRSNNTIEFGTQPTNISESCDRRPNDIDNECKAVELKVANDNFTDTTSTTTTTNITQINNNNTETITSSSHCEKLYQQDINHRKVHTNTLNNDTTKNLTFDDSLSCSMGNLSNFDSSNHDYFPKPNSAQSFFPLYSTSSSVSPLCSSASQYAQFNFSEDLSHNSGDTMLAQNYLYPRMINDPPGTMSSESNSIWNPFEMPSLGSSLKNSEFDPLMILKSLTGDKDDSKQDKTDDEDEVIVVDDDDDQVTNQNPFSSASLLSGQCAKPVTSPVLVPTEAPTTTTASTCESYSMPFFPLSSQTDSLSTCTYSQSSSSFDLLSFMGSDNSTENGSLNVGKFNYPNQSYFHPDSPYAYAGFKPNGIVPSNSSSVPDLQPKDTSNTDQNVSGGSKETNINQTISMPDYSNVPNAAAASNQLPYYLFYNYSQYPSMAPPMAYYYYVNPESSSSSSSSSTNSPNCFPVYFDPNNNGSVTNGKEFLPNTSSNTNVDISLSDLQSQHYQTDGSSHVMAKEYSHCSPSSSNSLNQANCSGGSIKTFATNGNNSSSIRKVYGTYTASGEKIRRPPNAFMIFAKERRREILYSNQRITNKEVSKQLGLEWRNLTEEIRARYQRLSEELRHEHQLKYPGYYYSPVEARKRKEEKKLKKITQRKGSDQQHQSPGGQQQQPNISPHIQRHTGQSTPTHARTPVTGQQNVTYQQQQPNQSISNRFNTDDCNNHHNQLYKSYHN